MINCSYTLFILIHVHLCRGHSTRVVFIRRTDRKALHMLTYEMAMGGGTTVCFNATINTEKKNEN
jgi:hypothetical protein